MKKILFATTALVATAGVAAADVTFGGLGRFGLYYNDSMDDEFNLTSRFRLVVTGTAESDNGLSFGAQVRLQLDGFENSYGDEAFGGFNTPRFWVSTGGFTVSVGNTLGAIENMPGMYTGSIGLTGLSYANVVYNFGGDGYSSGGAGRYGIDVIYAQDNWGLHFSHTGQDYGFGNDGIERNAIHFSYSTGQYSFAVGFQDSNNPGDTEWAATASGTFGSADVALQVADNDGDMKWGIAGNVQVGASTFIRGYINTDESIDDENFGIGFQHRLGGGTFVEGGVADLGGVRGATVADLGLRFSF